jgi:glycosyltransferase involved in cell wall biosynthesis
MDDKDLKNDVRVSVIMATYNRGNLISETIKSVLNQSFTHFEFIIMDDGSTDQTSEIVRSFKDNRIRYIFQANQGRSKARNDGIHQAKGEYIAFIDSDDLFLSNKLEKQVNFLDINPEVGMSYTKCDVIDDFGNQLSVVYEAPVSGCIYYDIAFYLPVTICLPTVMVRREILLNTKLFDVSMERFEDTDLWRRISKITKIASLQEILTTIRTHQGNQMEDPKLVFSRIDYYVKKAFREDTQYSRWKQRILAAKFWFHYGWAVLHHPNPSYQENAIRFILASLRLWPFQKDVIYLYLNLVFPVKRRNWLMKFFGRLLKKYFFSS